MKTVDDFSIVSVKSFAISERAEIYKALLESTGIECALWHSQTTLLIPFSGPPQIDLVVRIEDRDKAIEALNAGFDESEVDEG